MIRPRFLRPILTALLPALILGALLTPSYAGQSVATTQLHCKGVAAFGDQLARAADLTVDLARGDVSLSQCRTDFQLGGFCHGVILAAKDHYFQFGLYSSKENTRLQLLMMRDGTVPPYDANASKIDSRKVQFLGRCESVRY